MQALAKLASKVSKISQSHARGRNQLPKPTERKKETIPLRCTVCARTAVTDTEANTILIFLPTLEKHASKDTAVLTAEFRGRCERRLRLGGRVGGQRGDQWGFGPFNGRRCVGSRSGGLCIGVVGGGGGGDG
eukprot:2750828-Rhodomonas_salina.3